MTKKQVLHILGLLAVGALSAVVDHITKSDAVWGPVAVALLVDLKNIVGAGVGIPPGPPAAALVLLAALGLSGCGTLGPTPPPGTPGIANCSDAALHQAELNILPSVENALASPDWESALLTIVATVGGPLALEEVSCVVAWVESEADKAAPTTADSLEATKAAHARAWLAKHPVGP